MQVHGISLICSATRASSEACMMHTVATRSRATATAAILKGPSCFFTDIMMAPHAVDDSLATTVREACDGFRAEVDNHRFSVLPLCYGLTTVLRRTLTYALGRSGRARRDLHGQLTHSSL